MRIGQRAGRLVQRPRSVKADKRDVYRASIILADQKIGPQGTKEVIRELNDAWRIKGPEPFLKRANEILKKHKVI